MYIYIIVVCFRLAIIIISVFLSVTVLRVTVSFRRRHLLPVHSLVIGLCASIYKYVRDTVRTSGPSIWEWLQRCWRLVDGVGVARHWTSAIRSKDFKSQSVSFLRRKSLSHLAARRAQPRFAREADSSSLSLSLYSINVLRWLQSCASWRNSTLEGCYCTFPIAYTYCIH